MSRFLFLDIDGVLATPATYRRRRSVIPETLPEKEYEALLLDPACVAFVQQFCDKSGARIVLSTSWRLIYPLKMMRGILRRSGLLAEVVGETPRRQDGHRGREIEQYVVDHVIDPKDIIILDDELDLSPLGHRHVLTSCFGRCPGFRRKHLRQALHVWGISID
jgi:hypothetical protein